MASRNDYDRLSTYYLKTHEKPDKKYSMLPTMLKLLDLKKSFTVIDVGCGDGFFTRGIALKVKKVIGVDNSKVQIDKAQEKKEPNTLYYVADMFTFEYPLCDRISCPFVLNYVKEKADLEKLFRIFYTSLNKGGRIVCLLDMPAELINDRKKWGAIKRIHGTKIVEGAAMDIELYHENNHLVTLHSTYHEKSTIKTLLEKTGFIRIREESPVVSEEGIKTLGDEFWNAYKALCDVSYIVAEK